MFDCVIVGAGFAGLIAARELTKRGYNVHVIEARAHIGGRAENAHFSTGELVEHGAQWVFPDHDRVRSLIDEASLRMVPASSGKLTVVQHGARRATETKQSEISARSPFAVADLGQGVLRLQRLAERVVKDPHWVSANKVWLDQSIDQWVQVNVRTPQARSDMREVLAAIFGDDLVQVSLREVLEDSQHGLDVENMIATNGDVGQMRLAGGIYQLLERLSDELDGKIRTNMPVVAVDQTDGSVTVVTSEGEKMQARSVIVTTPPWLTKNISFIPQLDQSRVDAARPIPKGAIIKCHMLYDRPWWRDEGWSGQASVDDGPVRVTFDTSDLSSARGIVMGFFSGAEADKLAGTTMAERGEVFRKALVSIFGEKAAHPIEYVDRDWNSDAYTCGTHGAHFAPGMWSTIGPRFGAAFGRVHFAGAEYASKFNGYVEGAVRSGSAAVAAVVAQLHSDGPLTD